MRVLAIGDCHCPGMRDDYVDFCLALKDSWDCNRVVFVGDVVDNAAISYHEKNPSLHSAEEESHRAKKQVQRLHEAFPDADWLIGNHDALTERQARTAGLPSMALKDYNSMWEVTWRVHPRFSKLEIDGVIYAHGDAGKGGMYAAVKNSRDNFQSWVSGHCHSEAGVWWTVNQSSRVFGMNVGCGIDHELMQFEYGRKFNRKPILGAGIVLEGQLAFFEPMPL